MKTKAQAKSELYPIYADSKGWVPLVKVWRLRDYDHRGESICAVDLMKVGGHPLAEICEMMNGWSDLWPAELESLIIVTLQKRIILHGALPASAGQPDAVCADCHLRL